MDSTQERPESLGFLGMCCESIKIISSYKYIFLQITLTLILPLPIVLFLQARISTLLVTKITSELDGIFNVLLLEYIECWINEATYVFLLVVFSLLSTSVVVYTVACVHSNNEITYKMVMGFIPKVWNSLLITLICNALVFVVYNTVAFLILVAFISLYPENDTKLAKMVVSTIYILYFIGFVYICVIWQLASAICVLEGSYGFDSMAKSKALIKGKMGVSAAIFLEINLSLGCIDVLFGEFVAFEGSIGVFWKIGFGALLFVLCFLLFLFGLVVLTVIYFVSESCVDDSKLSNHGYVLLEPKE